MEQVTYDNALGFVYGSNTHGVSEWILTKQLGPKTFAYKYLKGGITGYDHGTWTPSLNDLQKFVKRRILDNENTLLSNKIQELGFRFARRKQHRDNA